MTEPMTATEILRRREEQRKRNEAYDKIIVQPMRDAMEAWAKKLLTTSFAPKDNA